MNKKNLVQCVNGHYYDADQFEDCPHCGGKTIGSDIYDGEETVSFESGVESGINDKPTEPLKMDIVEDKEMTIGIGDYFNDEMQKKTELVVGWLVCINGAYMGQSFELKAGKNFIGRNAQQNDIVLRDDQSVSREKHAIIIYDPKSRCFMAQPGMSHELFYVNDKVVLQTMELYSKDVIAVGKTELMFIPFCGADFSWETICEGK